MSAAGELPIEIRPAVPRDAAAIASLLAELGYPTTAADVPARLDRLSGPAHAVMVAVESSGTPVGLIGMHSFSSIHADQPTCSITALAIAPAARGRGVGRALVDAAERWAREHGCRRLTVTSAEYRAEAHVFYPACGLPYTGRRFSKVLTDS